MKASASGTVPAVKSSACARQSTNVPLSESARLPPPSTSPSSVTVCWRLATTPPCCGYVSVEQREQSNAKSCRAQHAKSPLSTVSPVKSSSYSTRSLIVLTAVAVI